jgi:carbon monoxide dehydrogenase subunit G
MMIAAQPSHRHKGEPKMASGKAEASIARSPEDVWKVLRDFAGLADYMPGIESCTVDGDVRTIGTMGIVVKEQLRDLDDDTRRISYSVIESPMTNLVSHLATISVEAEGEGTHLVYSVDVEPDDLLALFLPIYEGSVVALKQQFES